MSLLLLYSEWLIYTHSHSTQDSLYEQGTDTNKRDSFTVILCSEPHVQWWQATAERLSNLFPTPGTKLLKRQVGRGKHLKGTYHSHILHDHNDEQMYRVALTSGSSILLSLMWSEWHWSYLQLDTPRLNFYNRCLGSGAASPLRDLKHEREHCHPTEWQHDAPTLDITAELLD